MNSEDNKSDFYGQLMAETLRVNNNHSIEVSSAVSLKIQEYTREELLYSEIVFNLKTSCYEFTINSKKYCCPSNWDVFQKIHSNNQFDTDIFEVGSDLAEVFKTICFYNSDVVVEKSYGSLFLVFRRESLDIKKAS